jgi:AcrR family transcriptional regulator
VTAVAAVATRSAERRGQILDAAERVVRRDGTAASMSAIAREAGITKPVVYRHFGDRDGLYQALAERQTQALLDAIRAALRSKADDRRGRAAAAIDAYLRVIEREPQLYRFLLWSPAAARTVTAFRSRLAAELAAGMRAETGLRPDVAAAWAVGIVGMVQSAGDWWLEERLFSRRRLVARLTDLLWGSYGA